MIMYKLLILILLLLFMIRIKIHLGLSLFVISLVTVLLFKISLTIIVKSLTITFIHDANYILYLSIIGITYIGTLMTEQGMFKQALSVIRQMGKDPRISLMVIPSIIGMVPMPGGALVSAPLVNTGGNEIDLPQYRKHCINYIYRHIWEFMLPIYPAILLINSTFKISLSSIIVKQFIYTLLLSVIAFFVCFNGFSRKKIMWQNSIKREKKTKTFSSFKKRAACYIALFLKLIQSIWPILAIIIGITSGFLANQYILLFIILLFCIVYKINYSHAVKVFKKSFSLSILLTVIAVIFFKTLIQQSTIFESFPNELLYYKIPSELIVFILPLSVSFLTGLMYSGVGVSFSILYPLYFIGSDVINYKIIMLSYIGSFFGIMISPTHLCFSLTKDYFKAEYKDIFRILLYILGIFLLFCVALYSMGYPKI